MGSVFNINTNRKIITASQNIFMTPAKHPTRCLNEHIVSYVAKGSWKLDIGGECINAKSGNVFVMPANVEHIGLDNCPAGTHTLFIHFSVAEGDKFTNAAQTFCENMIYTNNFVNVENNPEVNKLLLKIMEEYSKNNTAKASAYLNVLLCELSESSSNCTNDYTIENNIKTIINNNVHKHISNKEIAEMLNVGVRTAETAFKTRFGMTIHQYQLQEKIERAKFFLEYYPQMKIIDISLCLGFYDEYHFSRQFKKLSGLSPTDYRKSVLKRY